VIRDKKKENNVVHHGFEPGSPDSESGVITNYTNGPALKFALEQGY
jgi:hypothetical protein